jgi:hypothetical protein
VMTSLTWRRFPAAGFKDAATMGPVQLATPSGRIQGYHTLGAGSDFWASLSSTLLSESAEETWQSIWETLSSSLTGSTVTRPTHGLPRVFIVIFRKKHQIVSTQTLTWKWTRARKDLWT